jgi:hypothetical protein
MGDVDYPIPRPKSLIGNGSILILAAEPTNVRFNPVVTMPFGNLSSALGSTQTMVIHLV